jgi:hypothetical protein
LFASYAALKRRSSTVPVVLDTSKPQGLKPISNAYLQCRPEGLLHPLENPAASQSSRFKIPLLHNLAA